MLFNKLLKNVQFENNSSIKKIQDYAFENSQFESIKLQSSLHSIGSCSLSATPLHKATFQTNSSLKSIGSSTFHRCSKLNQIAFPSSLREIGNLCFESNDLLQTVGFGKNSKIKKINKDAFSECKKLSKIIV